MDDILKPFLSSTAPSPPKFNVNWGALAPMEEIIRPPKFGGRGLNILSIYSIPKVFIAINPMPKNM